MCEWSIIETELSTTQIVPEGNQTSEYSNTFRIFESFLQIYVTPSFSYAYLLRSAQLLQYVF